METSKLVESKYCPRCGTIKKSSEFYKGSHSKTGLSSYCRPCTRQYYKENPNPNQKKIDRGARLKYKFGITLEDYNKMFAEQNGCCAICGDHQSNQARSMAVDHCHDTGRVRGLLCMKCNTGIGKLGDSTELLRKAIAYLEK